MQSSNVCWEGEEERQNTNVRRKTYYCVPTADASREWVPHICWRQSRNSYGLRTQWRSYWRMPGHHEAEKRCKWFRVFTSVSDQQVKVRGSTLELHCVRCVRSYARLRIAPLRLWLWCKLKDSTCPLLPSRLWLLALNAIKLFVTEVMHYQVI